MYKFNKEAYKERMKWYTEARFGMFIHWGLYAIPARGEWVRSIEKMSKEEYMRYFYEFNPKSFDARVWARLAKEAGMKYMVLTAKHHDGFCLFDSQLTDFKSTNTSGGRDYVREFLEAAREEGLRVGLYFSLIDWYHEDYPHYGDKNHPMRDNEAFRGKEHNFNNYLRLMHGQVEELCKNYGRLDILWFDFSYDHMRGEKWEATKLINMVRSLQPGIIINNRLEVSGEGFGSLAEGKPTSYHGDFITPEKIIPPKGLFDKAGEPLIWESCITMNNSWGYTRNDKHYKPSSMIIRNLVECVSKGGNMILNVGPDAEGSIPEESVSILKDIGKWMRKNGESIYGCGSSEIDSSYYGRVTQRGRHLYYHIFNNTIGPMPIMGLKHENVKSIRLLSTGEEVKLSNSWVHSDYPEIVFADLGPSPLLPDQVDTVLKLQLDSDKVEDML